jgi:hypothetical protein
MKAARKPQTSEASGVGSRASPKTADQPISDKTAALLIAQAQQAFAKAARAAVAENDRLGIPTHGAVGGKLVVRRPHRDSAE